jgi:hypothetical protein
VPESADQRHNRELIELLNELRVALPGVQVLFALLLAVTFANGFAKLGRFDRDVFYVAFVAAAIVGAAFLVLSYGLPLGAAIKDLRRSPRAR